MSVVDVWPVGSMALLTKNEADAISLSGKGELYELYRNCSLAVLNSGNITDNSADLLENSKDFEINIIRNERGLKLELVNPPESAIVDGIVIKKLRNHLYSVLRDIIQLTNLSSLLNASVKSQFDDESDYITHLIFIILRNAQVLKAGAKPNIAVCWGGHSICKEE